MQMMTNQSYQDYWDGLVQTTAEVNTATLVRGTSTVICVQLFACNF